MKDGKRFALEGRRDKSGVSWLYQAMLDSIAGIRTFGISPRGWRNSVKMIKS